jgi:DNA-directed RNA polymerase alpha subunit
MITEREYLDAIKIINEYTEQVKKQTVQILKKTRITKTPAQLYFDWDIHFPTMEVRLCNILKAAFADKRICDITKKEFLSVRNAGKKSWSELCDVTGNNEF